MHGYRGDGQAEKVSGSIVTYCIIIMMMMMMMSQSKQVLYEYESFGVVEMQSCGGYYEISGEEIADWEV